jgi:hypothetical protein
MMMMMMMMMDDYLTIFCGYCCGFGINSVVDRLNSANDIIDGTHWWIIPRLERQCRK